LPPKKDVAWALLEGPSLYIHLDPRKPDVVVPTYFKKQHQLVLQVGLNMAIPIPDLKVDDEGVTCTLSFNRKPFWCRLPWTAIFALVGEDMKGMVWPDDVPAEVAAQQRVAKPPDPAETKAPRSRSPREARRRPPPAEALPPPKKLAVVPEEGDSRAAAQATFPFPGAQSSSAPAGSSQASSSRAGSAGQASPLVPASRDDDPTVERKAPSRESPKPGKRELPPYLRVVK